MLLSLGSIYFFIKLLKPDAGKWILAGYIASTTLLLYTQVYSLFVIAAENLFLLLLFLSSRAIFRRAIGRWLLSQIVTALLFAPWLLVLSHQITEPQRFWIRPPSLFELRYAFLQIAGSYRFAKSFPEAVQKIEHETFLDFDFLFRALELLNAAPLPPRR